MEKKAETRYNPLNGRSIIFAPARNKRPNDTKKPKADSACPFCTHNLPKNKILQQLPNKGNWRVAAINNIFPALSVKNKQAYGYQEIIIDSDEHQEDFCNLSLKQIESVLKLFQLRSQKLTKDKKINYILCFKNQGRAAGASLRHIHSQVFASSILPPDIIEERNRILAYQLKNNKCPYCQLGLDESRGLRLITQDQKIIAFCPFASEFPYEAWITTRRHVDNISLLSATEISSLARALKLIALKLKGLDYDFNFFTHNDIANQHQHFYLKIQPRSSIWAGVELGSGLIINQILPEAAAKYYRQ